VPRIDKILSIRGGYSRKMATKMIRRGRVSVDGEVIRQVSLHHKEDCRLTVDGYDIPQYHPIILFHKPSGMLSSMSDSMGRDCVGDLVPPRYHIVGRLDLETRGLLLFSLDGNLTQWILHPKRAIERHYIATVEGEPKEELIERLAAGIETSVGLAKAEVLQIDNNKITLVMREGRNRIVRRMLHNAGHSVIDLLRVRFGSFELSSLEEGQMRPASKEEQEQLKLN
jgi:23S rRNA pseudouridine2605 synthase